MRAYLFEVMIMQEKRWFRSKAVWGGIVAVISAILSALGYAVDVGSQEQLIVALTSIGGAVGGVVAVYGRVKAEGQVTK